MQTKLFIELAYALGVGLLVGLERSMHQGGSATEPDAEKPPGNDDTDESADNETEDTGLDASGDDSGEMGIRTFAVLSLVGYAAALASDRVGLVAPAVLIGVCILVVAMYIRGTELGLGITTEVAAIGTCVLGVLCHYHPQAAGALALVLTVVLASKRMTHSTVRKMRRVELTDTLKFLIAIFIVLPLLPNRALDPYGALNPFKVGLLVVLISGISFVGYFLTRILGAQKGLGITGIVGGLTSSTAVTAAMAQEAKGTPALREICAFSTIGANATMFVRVLVVVAVLDQALALKLAWPIGAMGVVAAGAAALLWIRAGKSKGAGGGKVYAAAALSGLADVDAITLTIAEQSKAGTLAQNIGALAITIAVVSNSVVKTGIAIYAGGWKFGRLVGICLGVATGAGLVVAFFV